MSSATLYITVLSINSTIGNMYIHAFPLGAPAYVMSALMLLSKKTTLQTYFYKRCWSEAGCGYVLRWARIIDHSRDRIIAIVLEYIGLSEHVDAMSLLLQIVVGLNVCASRATEQESTPTPAMQTSGETRLRVTTWSVIVIVWEQLVKPSGLIIFIVYQHVCIVWPGGMFT